MKKVILIGIAIAIASILASCTDAQMSKVSGIGNKYTVTVLGGDTIMVFHSTGKVASEDKSDGYYFTNEANGKLVEVSGNVVIEEE